MTKDGCIYHPSCFTCPEPICIFEYPGGPESFFYHKALQEALDSGMTMGEAAEKFGIKPNGLRRRRAKTLEVLISK